MVSHARANPNKAVRDGLARARRRLRADAFHILLSIFVAWFLVKTGLLTDLIGTTARWDFVQSFVAGFFFTSLFTLAPATVVLAHLVETSSLFSVAFLGALGAVAGDMALFKIFREHLLGDAGYLLRSVHPPKAVLAVLHSRFFRFLTPLLGAFLLASPLPDEPALALMGLSHISLPRLIAVSFALHFIGILAVAAVAHAV